jgi:glycine betaine/proline transport system ATP-binding protein
MQQRVGIARALAAGTDILLMDEAFSSLGPLIRRGMQDLLLDLQGRLNKTIVFITHDLNEAMRLGHRIAMLQGGRVIQIGTAEEILTDPANDYVAQFVATPHPGADRGRARAGTGPPAARRHTRRTRGTSPTRGRNGLDRIVESDVQPVDPETPVADLFARCAKSLPVPVTDEDGKLLGVIPRSRCSPRSAASTATAGRCPVPRQPRRVRQNRDHQMRRSAVTAPAKPPTARL